MTQASQVRRLSEADLTQANALSKEAGWNQTVQDWRTILALAPEACFGIDCDGCLAATASVIVYGRTLAWVGMVLTRREYRGRGLASELLKECLRYADSLEISTVQLDATEMGQSIYQRFGFEPEVVVERWATDTAQGHCTPDARKVSWRVPAEALDRAAFGADRFPLIERLAEQSTIVATANGFAFVRPGHIKGYLGPCVTKDSGSAVVLLNLALSHWRGEALFWDLLATTDQRRALALSLGFSKTRRLMRMRRGPRVPRVNNYTVALAGFEFG